MFKLFFISSQFSFGWIWNTVKKKKIIFKQAYRMKITASSNLKYSKSPLNTKETGYRFILVTHWAFLCCQFQLSGKKATHLQSGSFLPQYQSLVPEADVSSHGLLFFLKGIKLLMWASPILSNLPDGALNL